MTRACVAIAVLCFLAAAITGNILWVAPAIFTFVAWSAITGGHY